MMSGSSFRLLPPCCLICGRRARERLDLCEHCARWLPWCRDSHPAPDLPYRVVSLFHYRYPIDTMVAAVKYHGDLVNARVLGSILGDVAFASCTGRLADRREAARDTVPDILLPMPLHPERQRQRGFNQALELARWASRRCGIAVGARLATRVRDTGSLTGLSRSERQLEIVGAFAASPAVAGRHIGIVDDVVTTGASARELARELQDTGARSVSLWTIAATPPPALSGDGS